MTQWHLIYDEWVLTDVVRQSFFKSVRDAPREVRHVQNTLETIAKVLDRLKYDDTPHADDDIVVQALQDCQESLQEIERMIANLGQNLGSGNWTNRLHASIKVVNKGAWIGKARDELYKAQQPLMLALQISTRSVVPR